MPISPFLLLHTLVTSFAKKTGDYVSLSPVDLRLIALTYQLECELGPEKGKTLREEPCRTVSVRDMGEPLTEDPLQWNELNIISQNPLSSCVREIGREGGMELHWG